MVSTLTRFLLYVGLVLAASAIGLCIVPSSAIADEASRSQPSSNKQRNLQEALDSAESGDAASQLLLFAYYRYNAKDDQAAIDWLQRSVDQNYPAAIQQMAALYFEGDGVPQDKQKAVSLHLQAADLGMPISQHFVATLYRNGLYGIPKKEVQYRSWLRKSANGGYASAQSELGVALYFGDSFERNQLESLSWLRKASEQDDKTAQALLGDHLWDERFEDNSIEVAYKTRDEASKLIVRAAEQGHPEAIKRLFFVYFLIDYNAFEDIGSSNIRDLRWHVKRAKGGCPYSMASLYFTFYVQRSKGELKKVPWLTEDYATQHYKSIVETAPESFFSVCRDSIALVAEKFKKESRDRLAEDLRRGVTVNVGNPFDANYLSKIELAAETIDQAYREARLNKRLDRKSVV
jgi:TPR repeat protein